jgi:hypothetical protein
VPKFTRVCRKTVTSQATFEKELFAKVNRGQQRSLDGETLLLVRAGSQHCKSTKLFTELLGSGDILLFDDVAVLYKRVGDLIMVVTGCQTENELILHSVLSAMAEALTILLRYEALLHDPF